MVIHQGALGDFILSLPAIWALYGAMTPKPFAVAGHPWAVGVLEGVPEVDLLDVNTPPLSSLWTAEAPGVLPFPKAVVFSNSPHWREGLKRAGVKEVWTLPPFPQGNLHLMDHHLRGLLLCGVKVKTHPDLFLSSEERKRVRHWLREEGIEGGFVVLHPGAGSSQKVWPPERMAEVAQRLRQQGLLIVLVEGPADDGPVKAFLDASSPPDLLLKTPPLRKLAAVLSEAALFIGNDAGVAHLAAAAGAPTLVLFGPTDPSLWAPRGRKVRWIQSRTPCAPCSAHRRRECPRNRCMEDIPVEAVYTESLSLLYDGERRRR